MEQTLPLVRLNCTSSIKHLSPFNCVILCQHIQTLQAVRLVSVDPMNINAK